MWLNLPQTVKFRFFLLKILRKHEKQSLLSNGRSDWFSEAVDSGIGISVSFYILLSFRQKDALHSFFSNATYMDSGCQIKTGCFLRSVFPALFSWQRTACGNSARQTKSQGKGAPGPNRSCKGAWWVYLYFPRQFETVFLGENRLFRAWIRQFRC